ncbi:MAG TPA: hypothetical protein VKC59_04245 [Candidatus Limnocylindrales bacterium]|nr:hypothetical protein [Candidatus Limnocylindrales bacterium]
MPAPFEIRLGAIAGWVALIGVVLAFIVIPMALAGQPPTVNTAPEAVVAYFRHPEFALINGVLGVFVGIVAIVPFGYGLRSVLLSGHGPWARTFADLGFVFLLVAAPVYLVSSAMGAMLVQASTGDAATFASLFRFYDVLYDGGADVLEGAWIGAFSVAVLASGLPRWLGWLGVVVMVARWIKAFVPVAPVPEIVIPIGGVLFLAWFLAIVVALTLEARRPARVASPVGVGAAA